mgnify:CR=1 FL=1
MKEKSLSREQLIDKAIEWKLRNPSHVRVFVGDSEVVIPHEINQRLNPDIYPLPRVYKKLYD